MKKKVVAGVLLGMMLLTACGKKVAEEPKEVHKKVVTTAVESRKMSQIYRSDAILEPKEKVKHNTEKGGTLEKIYKKNGEAVRKGELVMSLSDPMTRASYLKAKADFQTAESSYQIAKGNYEKFKTLYDKELVSHLEYVNYENAYVAAKGNYEVAEAMYQNAKSDYDKLERRADISGVVGNLFEKEGNTVKALENVFIVLDDREMQAYVGLPASYIARVKVGDSLTVHVDSIGKDYAAKIAEINPIADPDTKNFLTKLVLKNPDKQMKDGMYASIELPIGSKMVLAVPDEAIFVRNLTSYVYKVVDGKAERVEVETASQNGDYTEISSDQIQEGDLIVWKGLFGLQDGDTVEESHMKDFPAEKSEN